MNCHSQLKYSRSARHAQDSHEISNLIFFKRKVKKNIVSSPAILLEALRVRDELVSVEI